MMGARSQKLQSQSLKWPSNKSSVKASNDARRFCLRLVKAMGVTVFVISIYVNVATQQSLITRNVKSLVDVTDIPADAQVGPEQVQTILNALPRHGSMLVWGLGNDSPYWHRVTGGNVVFLEDDFVDTKAGTQWFDTITTKYPYLEAYKVHYTTDLVNSWKSYHNHPNVWKSKLIVEKFPEQLWSRHWDVILVDAPLGCCNMGPGRYQSLYTSLQLVERQRSKEGGGTVHVFVDDYERQVERDFSREIFDREPVKIVKRKEKASNANEQACFVFGDDVQIVKPNFSDSSTDSSNLEQHEKTEKEEVVSLAASSTEWTILITVNDGYYDFMLNWLSHFDKLGLKVLVIVIAEDDVVYDKLKWLGLPANKLQIERSALAGTGTAVDSKLIGSLNYDTKEYKTMVSTRASNLLRYLREGKNLIYTDVDTVWRSNPLMYLDNPSTSDYDMLIQVDTDKYEGVSPYYCTGFMATRSNERTIKLMADWETELQDKPQLNQPIFNAILHKRSTVKHFALSRNTFPSGLVFDSKHAQSKLDEAVVVHNNYIQGHDAKKDRFVKHNLWRVGADLVYTRKSS
jgi:uncharacterized protein (TIGR01627 family)